MAISVEDIRLQLAMAFGQGSSTLGVTSDALSTVMASNAEMIETARGTWDASSFPFLDLVRRLGQISATLAIMDGEPEIKSAHVLKGITIVSKICPCVARQTSK
jgi:hypothetical protein